MSGDGGTAAGPPRTTDQLAAQLRADPVALDQLVGSGRTAELEARLTRAHAEVTELTGLPVYLVAVTPPTDVPSEDPSKDLAVTLPRRLGDGVYLIDCGDVPQVAVRGTDVDETRLSLLLSTARDAVSGDDHGSLLPPAVQAETVLEILRTQDPALVDGSRYESGEQVLSGEQVGSLQEVAALTAEPQRPGTISPGFDEEPATTGDLALWGATSGVLVLAVVYLTLRRAWPGTRGLGAHLRPRPPSLDDAERRELEEQVRRNLDRLAQKIARVLAPRDAAALERAVAAREAAEHLVPAPDDSTLVGALCLTRIGLGDVRVAVSRRAHPWRPCFVSPLHGEATGVSGFDLDDAALEVPVCDGCAESLRRDRPLRPFRPRTSGRDRPYYEGDDVWARTGYGSLDPDLARTVLREGASR